MPQRIAKRLLIVGWDAADWKIIDALFAIDALPNLRRLVDRGVRANLASLEPRLSPLLWSSIATGKTPDQHGILNFVEPDPAGNGLRITSSTSRKTKALWNMLTQSGLRTNVVSWYASHPAEPINGVCVSNLFQEGMPGSSSDPWPIPTGAVHPASMVDQIAQMRMHPSELTAQALLPLLPGLAEIGPTDRRVMLLVRSISQCTSVHNAVTAILADDRDWDCTMVFYDTIDSVGHNFMQYHPPRMPHVSERDFELFRDVMFSLYQFHDLMLGTLLELAGEDTTLILVSDHGFFSDHRRPVITDMSVEHRARVEASWHRQMGVLAMSGPGIRTGQQIYGASLLDITPTALTLLGLPIGADMAGRVLTEAFDRPAKIETLLSWDMLEGQAGMHPADLRQDPFEARDAINQLVELGYMAALPEDAKAKHDLAWRESQCNLGTVLTTNGHSDKAAEVFEELTRRYPNEPRFVFGLARAQFMCARFTDEIRMLKNFLQHEPGNLQGRIMLAVALASSGGDNEAGQVLDALEREFGDRADVAAPLADISLALARWDDADRLFRAALDNDPDNAFIQHGLARAAIGREQFDEAVDLCLQAVQLIHVFPDAHYSLGVALTWLKDYPHAIKSFEVALTMRPGMVDAHRYLASIHRHLGDAENAAKHRQIAERLIKEKGSGQVSIDFLKRLAPLGPQDWAKEMGITQGG